MQFGREVPKVIAVIPWPSSSTEIKIEVVGTLLTTGSKSVPRSAGLGRGRPCAFGSRFYQNCGPGRSARTSGTTIWVKLLTAEPPRWHSGEWRLGAVSAGAEPYVRSSLKATVNPGPMLLPQKHTAETHTSGRENTPLASPSGRAGHGEGRFSRALGVGP